ncbi:EcsC family protein [soil metagenome]
MELTHDDMEDLRRAKRLLENTSLAARLAHAVGQPIEKFMTMLPPVVAESAMAVTNKALAAALNVAVRSLDMRQAPRSDAVHKLVVGATGAVGGAFGLPAAVLEVPASTTLILRSIAEIAQGEGESLALPEARLACLQVFALGGPEAQDDAADSGYFAVRAVMARALEEASQYVATHGVTSKGAPVLVRFLTKIAARFGVRVSQKLVAQSVPLVGAVGGAAINVLFMAHFQDVARGHFVVRRLERKYGPATVRAAYPRL